MKPRALLFLLVAVLLAPSLAGAQSSPLSAAPESGTAPLQVTFTSLRGDNGPGRPSNLDAPDTLLDFGDGSERVWVQCTNSAVGSGGCATPKQITHTYAATGNYTAQLVRAGGLCKQGACATEVLGTVAIVVRSAGSSAQQPRPQCTMTASAGSVTVGQTVNLSWSSRNATEASITTIGPVPLSGRQGVIPVAPASTYTGTFIGAGGRAVCSITIVVATGGGGGGIGAPVTVDEAGRINPPDRLPATSGGSLETPQSPGNTTPGSRTTGSGIVPCSGLDCEACNLAGLGQRIINFLLGLSIPLATAMFAYAGVLLFTSAGSTERMTKAKKIFRSVLIGFLIVMTAWLLIQTALKTLLKNNYYKSWNTIECVGQSNRPMTATFSELINSISALRVNTAPVSSRNTVTVAEAVNFENGCYVGAALVNGRCFDDVRGEYEPAFNAETGCAQGSGLVNGECVDAFGSRTEPYTISYGSSGPRGRCPQGYNYTDDGEDYYCQGPGGANDWKEVISGGGTEFGSRATASRASVQGWSEDIADECKEYPQFTDCERIVSSIMANESSGRTSVVSGAGACGIMQMLPSTAREYDPEGTQGLSDSQVCRRLFDPEYGIALGTEYLAEMNQRYNGSCELIAASYNGGVGANNESRTCPGQRYWQCTQNRGYQETRNYVPRVCNT